MRLAACNSFLPVLLLRICDAVVVVHGGIRNTTGIERPACRLAHREKRTSEATSYDTPRDAGSARGNLDRLACCAMSRIRAELVGCVTDALLELPP